MVRNKVKLVYKGEAMGELINHPAIEQSVHESPNRAFVGPAAMQQPITLPIDVRADNHLDVPTFGGGNVVEWMFQLKFYFQVTKIVDKDKISMAIMKLSERALQWCLWTIEFFPFKNWVDFRDEFLLHYGGTTSSNIYCQFLNLNQEKSIQEYREEFEALLTFIPDILTFSLDNTFLN